MKRVRTWCCDVNDKQATIDRAGRQLFITVFCPYKGGGPKERQLTADRIARNVLITHIGKWTHDCDWTNFVALQSNSYSSIHTYRLSGADIKTARRQSKEQA